MKYSIICKEDDISRGVRESLKNKIKLKYDDKNPDYVIVVGGDGTFISAIHKYPNAIFFGIHTGHLGFFANYTLDEVDLLVEDLCSTKFYVEKLDLIQCQIMDGPRLLEDFAVNEMTILAPPKPLILDVYIDGVKLETFRGTGICVSTSYGSTAYNKSLFGAVVDPCLKAFQLTEIAGINSNQYRTLSSPLLLSSERTIVLKALESKDVIITCDQSYYALKEFQSIELHLKTCQISMAHHNKKIFIQRIRKAFVKEEL